jgi:arylsulfatase A-like enzyme
MKPTKHPYNDKVHWISVILIGACLAFTGTSCSQLQKPEHPNVIIIFTDDIGYGDLGCYGAEKVKTPNIDRLAKEGCMFSDAHSASAVCTPSRYALLTGEYPFRKDLFAPVFHKVGSLIDTNQLTIASLMKKSGYATACIGKWHLGFGEGTPDWNGDLKPGPLELGFDYYFGIPVVNSHPPFVYVENHRVVGLDPSDPFVYDQRAETREFPEKRGIDQMGGAKAAHALYDDEQVGATLTRKAINWIEEKKDTPFFLYFATTNIHHPFTPQPRFKGTSDCGRYGDFIHELDWIVGEIMKTLDDLDLDDNTLLIFTSDNGGMLNQGGQDAFMAGHRLNRELLGFKFDAWEGGHRVPFIVRWPEKVKPGTRSNQLICNVDMLASLAALTGYDLKPGEGPDSYNVLPAILGTTKKQLRDHVVLAAFKEQNLALRKDNWIYIGAQGGGGFSGTNPGDHGLGGPAALKFTNEKNSDIEDGKIKPDAPNVQLYDLDADLSQSRNVVRDHPEIATEMQELLLKIKQKKQTRSEEI